MMTGYKNLFQPGRIGSVELKNRIIMAPMASNLAHITGEVSDDLVLYYKERARGGVGLIIVEASCVDPPAGKEGPGQIHINAPEMIPGLYRLSEAIHAGGSKAFIQLFHAGRQTNSILTGGHTPVAPSALACPKMKELPHALSLDEVKNLEAKYVRAAELAAMAGFDGVELHAAHGYLINQFLSPESNLREDAYGGSLQNRMRFLLNIAGQIEKSVPQLALSVRLNIEDFTPQGLQMSESLQVCKALEQAGVDLIHCSCGTYVSGLTSIEPASYKEGWRVYLAEKVKKLVGIPVVAGGMIRDPAFADQVLGQKKADFIFLGRPLIADPLWPEKVRRNLEQKIRPCIACNSCIGNNFQGRPVRCAVNPFAGRESQISRERLSHPASAVVVGSGPAGMQAAISLQERGFSVCLYEAQDELGPTLKLASIPPYKARVALFRQYLIERVMASGVDIHTGTPFSAQILEHIDTPDLIVVATGASPLRPSVPGEASIPVMQATEVLQGKIPAGISQAVVVGGGSTGCELSAYLLAAGMKVALVEQETTRAAGMEKKNRRDLLDRLDKMGLVSYLGCRITQLKGRELILEDEEGQRLELEGTDMLVWAGGFEPEQTLYYELKQIHPQVYLLGDASQVGDIGQAVSQGEFLGIRLCSLFGDEVGL